ncbi:MAG: phosphoglycerate mutase family protein [Pyrinomonadaceae bacterium]
MANGIVATTVILVRHGDRDNLTVPNPDRDLHLNRAGKERAKTLAQVLGEVDIKAIYVSSAVRTVETAAPLAEKLDNMRTTPINEASDIKHDIMTNHAGEAVLVVGHSNSVPELVSQLSGETMPPINDKKFDHMFVVTVLDSAKANVVKLKYGKPN